MTKQRPYRAIVLFALILLGLYGLYARPTGAEAAQRHSARAGAAVIDGHAHLFPGRNGDYDGAARTAVEVMDRLGIDVSLVMPFPFGPNQRGTYEIDEEGLKRLQA